MDWKQSYSDISAELSILHLHELELRKRWEKARQAMDEHILPLDKALEYYNRAAEILTAHVEECERVEAIKREMESHMSKFNTLPNVIKSKRLQGMSYKQIAIETGYSESHIRNTICKEYKHSTHKGAAM
jgi:exonuclease VII small subunit